MAKRWEMTEAEAARWIAVPAAMAETRVRLLCLPHAGSGAAVFYRWRRMLPGWVAVCPALLPGRESRLAEPPLRRIDEVVEAVVEAAGVLRLNRVPVVLFGHSMGALLAYEVARRMGSRCGGLIVSGREAAQVPVGVGLARLGDAAMLAGVRARFGQWGGTVLEDPEVREMLLPILRADLEVVESYRWTPGVELACPVWAFAGQQDGSVSDQGLAGWEERTSARFEARRFEGDHFYHLGEGQEGLLGAIVEALEATG